MKLFLSFISASLLSLAIVPFANAVDAPAAKAQAQAVVGQSIVGQSVVSQAVVNEAAININTADVQTLTKLKGIGPKKAEAIVAWREANGDFKTVDQLLDVKGIGEATLAANRDSIRI